MPTLPALLPLLVLDRLPRTGWLLAGVPQPETVAAHSLGVALVALALAPRVAPALDLDRCLALAVAHDLPEAWLTDLPRRAAELLPPGIKAAAESRAARGLLAPLSQAALARFEEFQAGATREARFVRACDKLQLGARWVAYRRQGIGELDEFRAGIESLDCSEFAPCEEFRLEILEATVGPERR